LNPPNGTFEFKLFAQLIHAVPAFSLCSVLSARFKFCVNTAEASPYGVIRVSDHVVLVFKPDDDTNETKDFFLHDLRGRVDIDKDGGFDEVAFCSLAFTANLDLGTCIFSGLDVGHDMLCVFVC